MDWKYFKPEEAPVQRLHREPLPDRGYCGESLEWHTDTWDVPESQSNLFDVMGHAFYTNLYDAITEGAPLTVSPLEVRQQIAVIEECHRQDQARR
jgi:hypothetical protein